MADFFDQLDDELGPWLEKQAIFFVATAAGDGRINLSPKGTDCLRVLGPKQVGYLDLTGSGNETAAHLLADGRVTLMACSFEQKPRILRVYGTGRSVKPGDADWDSLAASFSDEQGHRQIHLIDVESVQTSCGWGVPLAPGGLQERTTLNDYWRTKENREVVESYQREKNAVSIDGMPTGIER